jgi:hypothetical protein
MTPDLPQVQVLEFTAHEDRLEDDALVLGNLLQLAPAEALDRAQVTRCKQGITNKCTSVATDPGVSQRNAAPLSPYPCHFYGYPDVDVEVFYRSKLRAFLLLRRHLRRIQDINPSSPFVMQLDT